MKNKPLAVIFITVFIDLIGFGMIIPLNPYLAREYGAGPLEIGLLMTVYSLMQFLFAPFWGQISDRVGRRPVILLTLLGVAVAHLWFAMAASLWTLFLARALAGFFGANIATAMAYIADVTPEKERSKGMGLIGAAFGLGFMLGPFFGGIFGEIGQRLGDAPPLGLSFAAVVAAGISLLNFLFAYFVLPESRSPQKPLAYHQAKPRFQLLIKHVKKPVLGPLMLTFFMSSCALAVIEAPLFLLVQDEYSWSLSLASFGFAYVGLIMVLTQGVLIRPLISRLGERKLLLLGLLFAAIGYGLIGLSSEVWQLAGAVTLMALGTGFINPAITGSISLLAEADEQGSALGVNQSFSAMGRIVGPAIGGWLYGEFGPSWPFFVASVLALGAGGLSLRLYRSLPEGGKRSRQIHPDQVQEIGFFQLENLKLNNVPFLFFALCKESELRGHPQSALLEMARPMTAEAIKKHLQSLGEESAKSHPIVLVCPDGGASTQLAVELEAQGYLNVYVLEGGLEVSE